MKILGFEIRFPGFKRKERQSAWRERVFEEVYLDFKSSHPPMRGTAEATEISAGGLRFAASQKIPPGTALNLSLRLTSSYPGKKQIEVSGRVLRSEKKFGKAFYRVVCAFESPDPSSQEEIQAFVSWLRERHQKYLFFRYRSDSSGA